MRMRRILIYLSFLLIKILFICRAQDVDKVSLINEHVERTIDLASTGSIAREVTKVSFKVKISNGGLAEEYLVAIPERNVRKLASLDATIDDASVEFIATSVDTASKLYLFRGKLPKPMASGTVIIKIAYLHRAQPYPAVISQGGKQYLEFLDSAYFISPYTTVSQKTTIKLPNSNVLTYSQQPSPASKSGSTINYGPYNDVAGYKLDHPNDSSESNIHVHYEDPRAVLVAKTLFRDVWVSHWGGKLSVEEHHELVNAGAKLKGYFSRVDYAFAATMQDRMNVMKQLTLTFPAQASNPYYRDTIGNVSTSRFRNEKLRSVMEIRPRYPVWGGWKYTWYHGYDVPLSGFLKHSGSRYVLAVPFLSSTEGVAHDFVKFRVVLPEGAKNIKIESPFVLDEEHHDILYWYLDTIGRPAVILEKKNSVDGEHSKVVYISYDYSDVNLLLKPLVASLVFFLLFVVAMAFLRLDISIIPDKTANQLDIVATYKIVVGKAHANAIAAYNNLMSAYEKAGEIKNKDHYTSFVGITDDTMNGVQQSLFEASRSAEKVDKKLARGATELCRVFGEKLQSMKRFHLDVLDILCSDAEVNETQKIALRSSLKVYEDKQEQMDREIKGLAKELTIF